MKQTDRKAEALGRVRRVVVKVGSNVLTDAGRLRAPRIGTLVRQMAGLPDRHEVVVVSSGAVAAGMPTLGRGRRGIEWRQAAAAVGQPTLMALWGRAFARHGRAVAQVLLTHADLADRRRHLNARHTLRRLLASGIVPIVNENDTVSVEELKLGDNDALSALTATLIDADLLVLLTDVPGLLSADPAVDPTAIRIPVADATDPALDAAAGPARRGTGTGGMVSKIVAARTAAAAGIPTVIAQGTAPSVLRRVLDPRADVGTLLCAGTNRLTRRKHWIAHTLKPRGAVRVDGGAAEALRRHGRSLLPSGIVGVDGTFEVGDCVRVVSSDGREIARGISSYPAPEVAALAGAHTRDIEARLGYKGNDEVIHRDDLVLARDGSD
jgi:glutamate 5-kinase